jgi:hypothetical protein
MPSNLKNILASFLAKQAAQGDEPQLPPEALHEMTEDPQQESLEHSPGGYEEGEVEPEELTGEHDDSHVEQLLSQLSPEEIEELTSLLAQDMHENSHDDMEAHDGMEAPVGAEEEDADGVDTAALAEAIQQQLANSPEANPENVSPEKMAALDFVKSASYIEGFIEQALEHGATVKEAVDIYDTALSRSIEALDNEKVAGKLSKLRKHQRSLPPEKRVHLPEEGLPQPKAKASPAPKESPLAPLDKVKVSPKQNAPKQNTTKEKAKSKDDSKSKSKKSNTGRNLAIGGGVAAGLGGLTYLASDKDSDRGISEKAAAYYEGVLEQARAHGFSDQEALALVKSAFMSLPSPYHDPKIKAKRLQEANAAAVAAAAKKRHRNRDAGVEQLYRLARAKAYANRGTVLGLGGLAAGLGAGALLSGD